MQSIVEYLHATCKRKCSSSIQVVQQNASLVGCASCQTSANRPKGPSVTTRSPEKVQCHQPRATCHDATGAGEYGEAEMPSHRLGGNKVRRSRRSRRPGHRTLFFSYLRRTYSKRTSAPHFTLHSPYLRAFYVAEQMIPGRSTRAHESKKKKMQHRVLFMVGQHQPTQRDYSVPLLQKVSKNYRVSYTTIVPSDPIEGGFIPIPDLAPKSTSSDCCLCMTPDGKARMADRAQL